MKIVNYQAIYFFTQSALILCFISTVLFAQSHTLSGYVREAQSGEVLIGVKLFDKKSRRGTFSNQYGFYSLQFGEVDSIELVVVYGGYRKQAHRLYLRQDSSLQIYLDQGYELEEVRIVAENPIEKRIQMSTLEISIAQIKQLPALLGEVDILKAYQLMPGVQSGSEGNAALYVRGGSPDQNLILLDDVPLYYVTHLGGFVSLFDANAISHSKLIKGGFPARYGGRLSSVMEVRMKDGNREKLHGNFSLGVLSARFALDGPIKKDTSAFLLSARVSTLGPVSWLSSKFSFGFDYTEGYNFYDVNAKWNRKLSDKDQVFWSFYTGDDRFFFREAPQLNQQGTIRFSANGNQSWGNLMSAFRWNHIHSPRLFRTITLGYTRFQYQTLSSTKSKSVSSGDLLEQSQFTFTSGVEDWLAKLSMEYYHSPQHHIRWGGQLTWHRFSPGLSVLTERVGNTKEDSPTGPPRIRSLELNIYAEDEWEISSRLKANVGLHFGSYLVRGKPYASLQPRLSANYQLGEHWALKASYSYMQQYLHLLTNSNVGLPTDLWVPATDRIKPQLAHQWVLGTAHTLAKGMIELSIEAFYKVMQQLIAYSEGANVLVGGQDWQDQVVSGGRGRIYGLEFLFQKKRGKTTGWIGYTLSYNDRLFEQLNDGKPYPYKYDRRHDLSLVISHQFSPKFSVSGNWVYGTGQALTLATANYALIRPKGIVDFPDLPFYTAEYYGEKNQFRMPAYHRIDISAQFKKQKPKGEQIWTLGLYNAYSRKNPFFLYYQVDPNTQQRQLYQFSLFPILPAISYQFVF